MSYRGISSWPPVWTQTRKDSVKTITGEVGVLCAFQLQDFRQVLVIGYERETYVGTLIFDSHALCQQVNSSIFT